METIEIIIKIFISLVNFLALSFICIFIGRTYRRMNLKVNKMSELMESIENKIDSLELTSDIIHFNQMREMKKRFIDAEQYELVKLIDSAIILKEKKISERFDRLQENEKEGEE